MLEHDHYTYRVTWSEEDGEYIGLYAEFPRPNWLDQSPEDALKGIHQIITSVVKDLENNGETFPNQWQTRH